MTQRVFGMARQISMLNFRLLPKICGLPRKFLQNLLAMTTYHAIFTKHFHTLQNKPYKVLQKSTFAPQKLKTKSPKPKKPSTKPREKAHLFSLKMLFASDTSAFTPDCILSPHFSQCGAISSKLSASLFGAMNFTLPHFLQTAIKGFGRIIFAP